MLFEDLKLNRQLLNAVADMGYEYATPIQEQAIPQIMAGHDILGIAQTGTGKTAAYLLPVLMKIKYAQGILPRAVITAPTRELVLQISDNLKELSKNTDLRFATLYGGVGPKYQKEVLANGVDIVVATPGRMLDLYLEGLLMFKHIEVLIIDEADKMMDMGFMPQIRRMLEVLPRKRQNLLFSATFAPKVELLAAEFLEYPVKVEVSPQATPVETVTQILYEVPNFKTKVNLLLHLLQHNPDMSRVFVFVRTRLIAENISKYLERKLGVANVRVIHANKGQNTRINAMDAFREGEIRVLVATDVAARGLDIPHVTHVINFDFPVIYEDYVHRIGRTGRAQALGAAITFMNKSERWHLNHLQKLIRMTVPQESIPGDVYIEETPVEEEQDMLRQIDDQRKKDDPTFQGAFHEKKNAVKIAATKARTAKATAKNNTKVGKKIAARAAQGASKTKSKSAVITAGTPKAKGRTFKANTMAIGATAKRQTGNRGKS